jgi:hypothetical protein
MSRGVPILNQFRSRHNPEAVAGMARRAGDVDSWDVCDQACNNLFYRAPFAYVKADAWRELTSEKVQKRLAAR